MKKILILIGVLVFGMSKPANTVQLEGDLAVVGNEPHTYLALITKNKEYKITNPNDFNLINLQNKHIKVKAVILNKNPMYDEIKVIKIAK